MASTLASFIQQPYKAIQGIFDEAAKQEQLFAIGSSSGSRDEAGKNSSSTFSQTTTELGRVPSDAAWVQAVSKQAAKLIVSDADIEKIPVLTAEAIRKNQIPPNTLVRYAGMVQDVFDPEYYAAAMLELDSSTGKIVRAVPYAFRDCLLPSPKMKSDMSCHTHARQSLYLVPPPGESRWARAKRSNNNTNSTNQTEQQSVFSSSSESLSTTPLLAMTDGNTTTTRTPVGPATTPTHKRESGSGSSSGKGKRPLHEILDQDEEEKQHAEGMLSSSSTTTMATSTTMTASVLTTSISTNTTTTATTTATAIILASSSSSGGAGSSTSSSSSSSAASDLEEATYGIDLQAAAELGYPLIVDPEHPALVRCYSDECSLRVGELVEIIGIYTHDAVLAYFPSYFEEELEAEKRAKQQQRSSSSDVNMDSSTTSTTVTKAIVGINNNKKNDDDDVADGGATVVAASGGSSSSSSNKRQMIDPVHQHHQHQHHHHHHQHHSNMSLHDVRSVSTTTTSAIGGKQEAELTMNGFLFPSTEITGNGGGGGGGGMMTTTFSFLEEQDRAKNPSPAAVPRIHAILVRNLAATYPLIQPSCTDVATVTVHQNTSGTSTPSSPSKVTMAVGGSMLSSSSPEAAQSSSSSNNNTGAGGGVLSGTASTSSTSIQAGSSAGLAEAAAAAAESTITFSPFGLRDPSTPTIVLPAITIPISSISPSSKLTSEQRSRTRVQQATKEVLQRASNAALQSMLISNNHGSGTNGVVAEQSSSSSASSQQEQLSKFRGEIISFFTAVLGGDALAAEYLLLHTLSQVIFRHNNNVQVLGKLTMNVSGFPDAPVVSRVKKASTTEETKEDGRHGNSSSHSSGSGSSSKRQGTFKKGSIFDSSVNEYYGNGDDIGADGLYGGGGDDEDQDEEVHGGGGGGGGGGRGHNQKATHAINEPPIEYDPVLPLPAGASAAAQRLYSALSAVIPRTTLIPLRIDNLNTLRCFPMKDTEANRLRPGMFQLTEGTYTVIDETVMNTGKLEVTGVSNLSAIQNICSNAQLPYDFSYFQSMFDIDYPILVLSHGRRSLLHVDVTVPLSHEARTVIALEPERIPDPDDLPREALERMRLYIASARGCAYSLPEAMARIVETDLVKAKGTNPTLTEEDLSQWLLLARLNAMSHGERTLTQARWIETTEFEQARLVRVNQGVASGGGASPAKRK